MTTRRVTFSLDSERDADLLAWLDRQANRSEYIRELIRRDADGHTAPAAFDEQRLRQILREELAKRAQRATTYTSTSSPTGVQEDPDLAAKLDEMF